MLLRSCFPKSARTRAKYVFNILTQLYNSASHVQRFRHTHRNTRTLEINLMRTQCDTNESTRQHAHTVYALQELRLSLLH